ncbi:hypothetical protein CTAYLR_000839 [Chrysophaeum taylorii]|uniref:Uncharacterized protein n=1 Tax=Chrysophaeum taylorii TaxID=2483200 RepID=A0AAD7UPZ3_9STRA|nr:hypothetical protein CTAYLR_000839 [Chrysophaeum taylorii]
MPSTTAVRITTISAAQNKRGKDCFEGGMETGAFTWFKDMGGNSNWMYIKVVNVSSSHVSLALWLLYEASTEPLVDPLTGSGSIQVGFFNQSKNLNRQVPLFELAEESKPGLEIGAGQSSTLKVRINDLSSHHQNQRFIIVIGPADAPIRGSRSVPIEIMSKPRVDSEHPADDARLGAKRSLADDGDGGKGSSGVPPLKRTMTEASAAGSTEGANQGRSLDPSSIPMLSALAAWTDPSPPPERKIEVIVTLLDGLDDQEKLDVYNRLGARLKDRNLLSAANRSSNNNNSSSPSSLMTAGGQRTAAPAASSSTSSRAPAAAATTTTARETAASVVAAAASAAPATSTDGSKLPPPAQLLGGASSSARAPSPAIDGRRQNGAWHKSGASGELSGAPTPADDENAVAAAAAAAKKPRKLQPLVKAMLAFQKSARDAAAKADQGLPVEHPEFPAWVQEFFDRHSAEEGLNFTEDQLTEILDENSDMNEISGVNTLEAYGGGGRLPQQSPPQQQPAVQAPL